jgi:hypothetical protein
MKYKNSLKLSQKITSRGHTLLELAIALPVLIVFGLGLLDISNYYRSKSAIQQAAEETLRCLASIDDCGVKPLPSIALYRISEVSGALNGTLPYFTPEGSIDVFTPDGKRATEFSIEYLSEALTSAPRVLKERTYSASFDAPFLLKTPNTEVSYNSAAGSYTVTNAVIRNLNISGNSTLSPNNRTVQLAFTTPQPPAEPNTPCYVGKIEGEPCESKEQENIENYFMLILEGIAKNGTIGEKSHVDLSIVATATSKQKNLGGQVFQNPGTDEGGYEPFIPRGSHYFTGKNIPKGLGEFKGHADGILLKYNTTYKIILDLRDDSDGTWQPTKAMLIYPEYKIENRTFHCVNDFTKKELELSFWQKENLCLLEENEKISFNSLRAEKAVLSFMAGEETSAGRPVKPLTCVDEENTLKDPEFYADPATCNGQRVALLCKGTTVVPNIPNIGVADDTSRTSDGVITSSSSALLLCPHENFQITGWRTTTKVINQSDISSIKFPVQHRQDCRSEVDNKKLIPTALEHFKNIKVIGSEKLQPEKQFTFPSEDITLTEKIEKYSCFKTASININAYLDQDKVHSKLKHPGCGGDTVLKSKLGSSVPEKIKKGISFRKSTERYSTELHKSIDSCQEKDIQYSSSEEGFNERPLQIPYIPLAEAKHYCKSHKINCSYSLVSFNASEKNYLKTFLLEKAKVKGQSLIQALTNSYGLKNVSITPKAYQNEAGQEVVAVTVKGHVASLLKNMVVGSEQLKIEYSSSRISERGLMKNGY